MMSNSRQLEAVTIVLGTSSDALGLVSGNMHILGFSHRQAKGKAYIPPGIFLVAFGQLTQYILRWGHFKYFVHH